MIEPIKKVTLITLPKSREQTLEALRDLEIMHLQLNTTAEETADLAAAQRRYAELKDAMAMLTEFFEPKAKVPERPEEVERLAEAAVSITRRKEKLQVEQEALQREIAVLEPWGDFDSAMLQQLREKGLAVLLCRCRQDQLPTLPDEAILQQISQVDTDVCFVVISPQPLNEEDLPVVALPEQSLSELRRKWEENENELGRITGDAQNLARFFPYLQEILREREDQVTFLRARDGMEGDNLLYFSGYIPARREAELVQAAHQQGWALLLTEPPKNDEAVPTLLRLPKWLQISRPIFDFIGILPGYREVDVSVSMLIFLTLFFGMIVGDAGYGLIFLTAALVAKWKISDPKKQLAINLFILMSITTVVWGALSGNVFAIPSRYLPSFFQGVPWLTDSAAKNGHVQWLCFLIAAIHLSLAHLAQALLYGRRRAALGHLGWGMVIWGNFYTAVELIIYPGSFPHFASWLYGVGAAMILLFGVNWRDAGEVLNLPFGFIGSFVDLLSYIRLFAVGLSSYFIAASFNGMGKMVYDISPWLIPGAIIVIALGHMLNILLALMGVLVHGIRLNTLEFSNHMGLSWSGRPFQPFRRQQKKSAELC